MFRLIAVLIVFFTITPAFIATIWIIETFRLAGREALARRYSRALCALLRVRVRVIGTPVQGQPALILCNHVSWLDIPLLASIGPVAFVAKQEVSHYPIVGVIAKLMRTVFVDRKRRHQTPDVNAEIANRMNEGHPVVLFAEGTSSDGNRVLAFLQGQELFTQDLYAGADPAHRVRVRLVTTQAWNALFAPKGTPAAIIRRLHDEVVRVIRLSDVENGYLASGNLAVTSTPEDFGAFIRADIAKWGRVVREAKIVGE